jgi:hypothetical protein
VLDILQGYLSRSPKCLSGLTVTVTRQVRIEVDGLRPPEATDRNEVKRTTTRTRSCDSPWTTVTVLRGRLDCRYASLQRLARGSPVSSRWRPVVRRVCRQRMAVTVRAVDREGIADPVSFCYMLPGARRLDRLRSGVPPLAIFSLQSPGGAENVACLQRPFIGLEVPLAARRVGASGFQPKMHLFGFTREFSLLSLFTNSSSSVSAGLYGTNS